MSDVPSPNTPEKRPDHDPYQETLVRIDNNLRQIIERNPETKYVREMSFLADPSNPEPIAVIVETIGTLDDRDKSLVRIILPSVLTMTESGRFFESSTVFIVHKVGDRISVQFFPNLATNTPRSILDPLLANELPDGIKDIVRATSDSLQKSEGYDDTKALYEIDLANERYSEIWDHVLYSTSDTPVAVSTFWTNEVQSDLVAPPSATKQHVSIEGVIADKSFIITSCDILDPDYFYDQQTDESGAISRIFQDRLQYKTLTHLPFAESSGEDEQSDIIYELQSEEEHVREHLTLDRAQQVARTLEDILAKLEN